MATLLYILIVGIIGTAALDVWQQIYRALFGVPITDWALIGRWVGYFRDGQFVQENIGKARPVANERALGWLVHYIVGIGYAVVYLLLMWLVFRAPPSFASAMIFAAVSVSVTWFFMQPVLGAGVMASKAPNRIGTMAHDFTSHLALGVGLYVGDIVARGLLAA